MKSPRPSAQAARRAGGLMILALLTWTALSSLYMMWAYATPLPIGDQWDSAFFPDHFAQRLFALHNEHRPALGRLVGLADWYLTNGRNGVNIAFIALCFPVFAIALYGLIRMTGAKAREAALFTALAMAIQASAEQRENLLWGFQTAFVGSFAFASLAMSLAATIARPQGSAIRVTLLYALCLICSLFSVFSLASGLLTLIGVSLLFFLAKAPGPIRFSYPLFALAVIAFYLHGYSAPGDLPSPVHAVSLPASLLRYALTYLGSPFAPRGGAGMAALLGAFGFVLLCVLSVDALRMALRDRALVRSPAGVAYAAILMLALMVLGAAMMAALGRVGLGFSQAMSSRYGTPALAFWADMVVLCLVRPRLRPGADAQIFKKAGLSLGLVLAVFVAASQASFLKEAAHVQAERLGGAMAYMVGARGPSALVLYPVPDRLANGHIDSEYGELAARGKSIFADGWPQRLGARLQPGASPGLQSCRGALESRVALNGERNAVVRLSGWALLGPDERKPALIVFTDDNGTVVGFGSPGYPRKDLQRSLHTRRAANAGFVGFVSGAQARLHAYALTRADASAKGCMFAISDP